MLGQLKMTVSGQILDKVEMALQRLKAFEPEEGYYVAFSGGKDSQCVYHLCEMAGVKFDAHYSITSVDPPELVRFIKTHYPGVALDYPRDKDGKVMTMWSLIPNHTMPPTRTVRYCCEYLKETNGKGRVTVTGVRWAESPRRASNHGSVTVFGVKSTAKMAEELGANYKVNKSGGIILNDDNDEARRMVERCYRTRKTLVNPIVDWEDDDVWEFLNSNGIEHCCLYDRGHKRLGCIGCPMNTKAYQELDEYPIYRANYIKAFERMIAVNRSKGVETTEEWKDGEGVMKWWLRQ